MPIALTQFEALCARIFPGAQKFRDETEEGALVFSAQIERGEGESRRVLKLLFLQPGQKEDRHRHRCEIRTEPTTVVITHESSPQMAMECFAGIVFGREYRSNRSSS